jgi:predicted metal-dependent hydrolase
MHKNIENLFSYNLKQSHRARLMRISVSCDAGVVVTVPFGMQESLFEKFIKQKAAWIVRKLKTVSRLKNLPRLTTSAVEYKALKFQALHLAKNKVEYWNNFYNFKYNRVSVKNQRTRWGSCSKKGNLNFNYKIVHLKPGLLDYLIVHELCHLKEMNHSRNFWDLVGRAIPEYKLARKELKNIIIQ